MHALVLNLAAVLSAAAHIGIIGEVAVVDRLGRQLNPVNLGLVAAIVIALPVSVAVAFSVVQVEAPLSGMADDLLSDDNPDVTAGMLRLQQLREVERDSPSTRV